MANKIHTTIISYWILLLLVASLNTINYVFAQRNFGPIPKGTVKSIEVPEDGDMIDCVDIHKQPAFDHPLIKGLEVSLRRQPEQLPNHRQYSEVYQTWHKYGECPEGTIPIRRTHKDDIHQKHFHDNSYFTNREYARVVQSNMAYQGAFANVNVWNPKVEPNEFSTAQLWVQGGYGTQTFASLEAGLIVYPNRYHDSQTRLFIHWTDDNYNKTGCFDLDCSGFVQIDRTFAIGAPLKPISQYNGTIREVGIGIYKDRVTGNWYFKFRNVVLGYWPKSITIPLQFHAYALQWGGEILNNKPQGHHTSTEMGSGHFSRESFRKAALMRNLEVLNNDYVNVNATPRPYFSNWKCYSVTIGPPRIINYRTHFYFGGPGRNMYCP